MEQQTLVDTILREAKRDFFNGKGRIFLPEFLRSYGVTEQSFMETLEIIKKRWQGLQIWQSALNDEILFFDFGDPNQDGVRGQTNKQTKKAIT